MSGADCRSAAFGSSCQTEPPTPVLNEPSCYHFRVPESRVFAIVSATSDAVTIGHWYHTCAWLRGRGVVGGAAPIAFAGSR